MSNPQKDFSAHRLADPEPSGDPLCFEVQTDQGRRIGYGGSARGQGERAFLIRGLAGGGGEGRGWDRAGGGDLDLPRKSRHT